MPISNRASFALVASIIIAFLAGASAPTPLYPTYQAAWGFSSISIDCDAKCQNQAEIAKKHSKLPASVPA